MVPLKYPPPQSYHLQQEELHAFEINADSILTELLKLPNKVTKSSDGIPPVVFKRCARALVQPITHLLKMSLRKGKIPDVWRHIIVQPIHKKGDKKMVTNYRPIGLTCIMSKISERIIRNQMLDFLQRNGMVSDKQHGFRNRRSTVTSLLTTQTEWKQLLQINSEIFVAYFDFSKAFDVVSHRLLKGKLFKAGLRGLAFDWISDYLLNRTMTVVLDGCESAPKPVSSGVIQGSAMGPALFSFFADELPLAVNEHAGVGMFADDVKTFSIEKTKLVESSNGIFQWSISNELPLAKDKTIFIEIRRRRHHPSVEPLIIDNTEIQLSRSVKDLGVVISDDLEPTLHISYVITKAFKISNLILRIFKTNKIEIFKKAFYTLVLPILEYASVVWNPIYAKDINSLETVQRRFTKRAQRKCGIGVESYTTRLKRWRLDSLELRRLKADLVWVYKIIYGYVDINREQFFRICQTELEIKIYPLPLSSRCRNNTQFNTIANRTYRIWNSMPASIRNSVSVTAFKINLKKYDLHEKFVGKINM
jgi:hypothetical protein